MSDRKPSITSLQVDLDTGDFILTVPADFDFAGRQADIVLGMLPTAPARRHNAA